MEECSFPIFCPHRERVKATRDLGGPATSRTLLRSPPPASASAATALEYNGFKEFSGGRAASTPVSWRQIGAIVVIRRHNFPIAIKFVCHTANASSRRIPPFGGAAGRRESETFGLNGQRRGSLQLPPLDLNFELQLLARFTSYTAVVVAWAETAERQSLVQIARQSGRSRRLTLRSRRRRGRRAVG